MQWPQDSKNRKKDKRKGANANYICPGGTLLRGTILRGALYDEQRVV
jgi:hypothetical protein